MGRRRKPRNRLASVVGLSIWPVEDRAALRLDLDRLTSEERSELSWPEEVPLLTAEDLQGQTLHQYLADTFQLSSEERYLACDALVSVLILATGDKRACLFLADHLLSKHDQAAIWNAAMVLLGYTAA